MDYTKLVSKVFKLYTSQMISQSILKLDHFIQDMVQKGVVKLKYVPTKEQVVDVLTNPLACVNFEYF